MQLIYTAEKYSRNESYLSVSLCHSLCEKERKYSVNAWEEDVLFARLLGCKVDVEKNGTSILYFNKKYPFFIFLKENVGVLPLFFTDT